MSKRQVVSVFILLFLIFLLFPPPARAGEDPSPGGSMVLSKVSYYKADLVAVLQQLAADCGYNVVITPDVSGTVTVQFTQVTFEQALELIIKGQGLVYQKEGKNFFIAKPGKLPSDQIVVGYFHVYYADPARLAETLQKLAGIQGVSADDRTRTLVVTGTKASLDQAAEIIGVFDRKLSQITMEVKVVEISNSALRKLGADWHIDDSGLDWGLAESGTELIIRMIKGGHTWSVIFDSLASNGNARLITSPSVAAIDGQEASILIGNKVPFETKDKDGNITVTYLDVGVKLIFTPRVQQGDELAIDLKTQVNSIGEKVGNNYIIGAREVNSKIQAKIGETVFLGGLITQEEKKTLMKIPFFGDLFLVGKLFQRSETKKDDMELIITITPRWNEPVRVEQEGVGNEKKAR